VRKNVKDRDGEECDGKGILVEYIRMKITARNEQGEGTVG